MLTATSFRVAVMIPGILSTMSSIFILTTHYRLISRESQSRSNKKLIVYMQMAILGTDLSALIFSNVAGSCEVYSIFMSFFLLSSAIWGSIVARQLQLLVANRQSLNQALYRLNSYADESRPFSLKGLSLEKVRMSVFHILAWGFPFLFSGIIALITVTSEPMSTWCWFQNEDDNFAIRKSPSPQVLLFYVPLSITLIYNFSVLGNACLKHLVRVNGDNGDEHYDRVTDPLEEEISKLARNLVWFVLLSSIVSFWLCVAELVNVRTHTSNTYSRLCVFVFLIILIHLHGFANLIVYIQNEEIKECWRQWISRGRERNVEDLGAVDDSVESDALQYEENPLKYSPP